MSSEKELNEIIGLKYCRSLLFVFVFYDCDHIALLGCGNGYFIVINDHNDDHADNLDGHI